MSYARSAPFRLDLSRALLILAVPLACAAEVKPEFEDTDGTNQPADTAGTSSGGTPSSAGTSSLPTAGTTTSVAGSAPSNPFGGTSSSGSSSGGAASGGKANGGAASGGAASGGTASGGTASGGNAAGGKAGAAGAAGAAGTSAGGAGTGGCACPSKKTWGDNTTLAFGPGDCLDVAGALYLYTGTTPQTWANKDCNPTMQMAWCSGADYKFMLCK